MTLDNGQKLAIHGGTPAKQSPDPPMYPGGMAIADEEEAQVLEVLKAKRLFRYYGPGEGGLEGRRSWNRHLRRRRVRDMR